MFEGLGIGTVPQWGMLGGIITLIGIILRYMYLTRDQTLRSRQEDIEGWREECHKLRNELVACDENCNRKLRTLEQELWGQRRQSVQEQISLINVIMRSVDAPGLKILLQTLEAVRGQLNATAELHHAVEEVKRHDNAQEQ